MFYLFTFFSYFVCNFCSGCNRRCFILVLLDKCWISLIDVTTAVASSWIRLSYYLLWAPLVTRGGIVTREGVVIVGMAAVGV